jgi:hypothetical protein
LYPAEICEEIVTELLYADLLPPTNIYWLYTYAIRAVGWQVIHPLSSHKLDRLEKCKLLLDQYETAKKMVSERMQVQATSESNTDNDFVMTRKASNSLQSEEEAVVAVVEGTNEQTEGHKLAQDLCHKVLTVCIKRQYSFEKRREAFALAKDVFERSYHNSHSYVMMLRIMKEQIYRPWAPSSSSSLTSRQTSSMRHDDRHQHVPKDGINQQYIIQLFHDCCKRGLMKQDFITHLLEVAKPGTLVELFGFSRSEAEYVLNNIRQWTTRSSKQQQQQYGVERQKQQQQQHQRLLQRLQVLNMPPSWSMQAKAERLNIEPKSDSDWVAKIKRRKETIQNKDVSD